MLNLYRRHRAECEGGHAEESRSGEFEERKKSRKRCACFIFASGTIAGKFRRKQTGATEWEHARAIADAWVKAKSWDGKVSLPAPLPEPTQPHRITIEHAVKAFLAE